MVRGLVILALLQFSVCHPKDRECFPTEVESQISSDSEISLDITHVYTVQYGSDPYASETEKSKSRITLRNGESKTLNLYAAGYSKFNPRELYVRNNNGQIQSAIGSMRYFYNSVLVQGTTDWKCLNSSGTFSTHSEYRHGKFTYLRDRVDVALVDEDELSGTGQDIQCFNKIKPNKKEIGKTKNNINVKIGVIRITSASTGIFTTVQENFTLSLAQGEEKMIQTSYHTYNVEEYGDHNPRNLTILYSGENIYAAMAFQSEYDYHDSYYTNHEVRDYSNTT